VTEYADVFEPIVPTPNAAAPAPAKRVKPHGSGRKEGVKNKRSLLGEAWTESAMPAVKRRLKGILNDPKADYDTIVDVCKLLLAYRFGSPVARAQKQIDARVDETVAGHMTHQHEVGEINRLQLAQALAFSLRSGLIPIDATVIDAEVSEPSATVSSNDAERAVDRPCLPATGDGASAMGVRPSPRSLEISEKNWADGPTEPAAAIRDSDPVDRFNPMRVAVSFAAGSEFADETYCDGKMQVRRFPEGRGGTSPWLLVHVATERVLARGRTLDEIREAADRAHDEARGFI